MAAPTDDTEDTGDPEQTGFPGGPNPAGRRTDADEGIAEESPSIVESVEVHPSSITTNPDAGDDQAGSGDATMTHMDARSDTGRAGTGGRRGGTDVRPQFNQPGLGARLDIGTGGIDLGTGSGTGRTASRRNPRRGSKSPEPGPAASTREEANSRDATRIGEREATTDDSPDEDSGSGVASDYQPESAAQVTIDSGGITLGDGHPSLTQRGSAHKYQVQSEIARGGMGAVFRVVDTDIRRPIAMKVMIGDLSERHRVMRFLEEVQITGQLEHPGIPPVHDVGMDEAGNLFFTMKLVSGEPLSDIVRRLRKGRPYRGFNVLARRLQLFLRVCEAVAFAHSRGVIHRDIKPANIMVGDYGEVQVMDWGLARLIGRDRPGSGASGGSAVLTDRREMGDDLTLDGTVAGTPVYMPPEQARGEIDSLDERSDIWALGALLYELLTFVPPVTGDSHIEVLKKVVDGDIVPPRERAPALEIPRELEAIVLRAMTPRKAGRYRGVAQMQEEVQHFLDGETISHVRYSGWERARKALRRNRAFVAGGLTVLVLALISLGAFLPALDARHARERGESFEAGAQEHARLQRDRLTNLLAQLAPRVTAWETGANAHAAAVTAWHQADAALPANANPADARPMWEQRALARLRALEALTARAAAISLAQQALSLAESLDLKTEAKRIAAQLSKLVLQAGVPEMDARIVARLEPLVAEGEGLRYDNGAIAASRFAPARLHLSVFVPDATGPVSVRLFRMIDGDAYGAEPRALPMPWRHAQSPRLKPDFLADLIGQPLDAAFAREWPPAEPMPGESTAPADPALVGLAPLDDLSLSPGQWVAVLRWTEGEVLREERVALQLSPRTRVYRHVLIPAGAHSDDTCALMPGGWIEQREIKDSSEPIKIGAMNGSPIAGRLMWRRELRAAEWRAFIASGDAHPTADRAAGALTPRGLARNWLDDADDQPANGLSPLDAEAIAAWLTHRATDGSVFRLPTESEWADATACNTAFIWGDEPESRFGWFSRPGLPTDTDAASAHLIYDESPLGIHALNSVLREFTRVDSASDTFAVRGGSWLTDVLPLAARDVINGEFVAPDCGFRLVRILPLPGN